MKVPALLTSSTVTLIHLLTYLRGWIAPLVAVFALAIAFFGSGLWGAKKTYIIDAIVAGATLEFHGYQNDWYLGDAFFCVPKSKRSRRSDESASELPCDTRVYDVHIYRDKILSWPTGSSIRLRLGQQDRLELLVLDGAEALKKNTLIVLPVDYFSRQGALSFSGSATFGRTINSGAKDILYDGRYRVRESHVVSSLLGKRTYEIAAAELTRGDQVRVVQGDNPSASAIGFGHLSQSTDTEGAVRLVFHSTPGHHALEVSTFGMAEPALIQPDWIDSTLASPYVLVVGLFISLCISILELYALTRRP